MLKTHTVDVSMPNTSTVDNNFSPPKQTTAADYYQRISKPETSTQTTANDYCQRISKLKPSKQTTADDCYSKQTTADDCHRILKPKAPHPRWPDKPPGIRITNGQGRLDVVIPVQRRPLQIILPNAKLRVDVSMPKTHTADVSIHSHSFIYIHSFTFTVDAHCWRINAEYIHCWQQFFTSKTDNADHCISKPKDPESICFWLVVLCNAPLSLNFLTNPQLHVDSNIYSDCINP